MEKINIEAIFFDFDGTLAATATDILASWRAAIAACGMECPDVEHKFRIGPPVEKQVQILFPDCQDESMQKKLAETYKKIYDYCDFSGSEAYPCALELCRELVRRGKKIYIVTNKRWISTLTLSQKLGFMPFISGIYTPDIIAGKTIQKPEALALAVRISGITPENCLMVGDTELDIIAGKSAGCRTCAVTWGYGDPQKVADSRPDVFMHAATVIADFDRNFC